MLWSLFKKVVLADNFAPLADMAFAQSAPGAPVVIPGTIAFGLQIYRDFSAYSDIARGVAGLLGFDLMVNFKRDVRELTFKVRALACFAHCSSLKPDFSSARLPRLEAHNLAFITRRISARLDHLLRFQRQVRPLTIQFPTAHLIYEVSEHIRFLRGGMAVAVFRHTP